MLLRQFSLHNNLSMHIRENTDFPLQKSQQLLSFKANFEGCLLFHSVFGKKASWKLFFNIFLQFLEHFLVSSDKLYYQHKIWSLRMKKIQNNICWSSEMSARGKFPKLVEISKNLKNHIICPKFQCPKCCLIIPKLINLALLNVEGCKFRYNNRYLYFWKNFLCCLFPK